MVFWGISACFFLSGMASLAYQSIWMREAMGQFGVITPVISTVLVVFMIGLALGTAWGARMIGSLNARQALQRYALVEMVIAAAALSVAPLIRALAEKTANMVSGSDSFTFLLISQATIASAMIIPCVLIGLTLPLGMRFLETQSSSQGFSRLYFVNLIGAFAGCLLPLLAIEWLGFRGTTFLFAAANMGAAIVAFSLARLVVKTKAVQETRLQNGAPISLENIVLLLTTGMISLGAETIWLKTYIPVMGSSVYSFSFVLMTYLLFNFAGTYKYRQAKAISDEKVQKLYQQSLLFLPVSVALSALAISYDVLSVLGALSLLLLGPVCFVCGVILPYVMDNICKDNSANLYRAYRWNFLGCILGPLLTTYVLFEPFGFKGTLLFYTAIAAFLLIWLMHKNFVSVSLTKKLAVLTGLVVGLSVVAPDYEAMLSQFGPKYRDHVGSVVAATVEGQDGLFVNGINMTIKTTITKNMAHLPMTHINHTPQKALTICFGMGTTLRSLASWPLEQIYVSELSSVVLKAFEHFHTDASAIRQDPRVHLVADDGRRFLRRTDQLFDVITIDPPPPVYAAGSGLLYTREFLELVKSKLAKGGMLQHWIPDGDNVLHAAVYNALRHTFKHVKLYDSIEGWGVHFLASEEPIKDMQAHEWIEKMPATAQKDLMEWEGKRMIEETASLSLRPLASKAWMSDAFKDKEMTDDLPYNEFMLLRKIQAKH